MFKFIHHVQEVQSLLVAKSNLSPNQMIESCEMKHITLPKQ